MAREKQQVNGQFPTVPYFVGYRLPLVPVQHGAVLLNLLILTPNGI